jgi:hypothetical protein
MVLKSTRLRSTGASFSRRRPGRYQQLLISIENARANQKTQTYVITKTEIEIINKHIWDLGLRGVGNKRGMENLYMECALTPGMISRRDKLAVSFITCLYWSIPNASKDQGREFVPHLS